MADKLSGGDKTSRKQTRETPGKGHNIDKTGKDYTTIANAYLAKKAAMKSDMAGYRSEINEIYDKGSEKLGVKKTVLSKELKRLEAAKLAEEKEKELPPDEREQIELLRASLERAGGELFRWAAGELAPSAVAG